MVYFMAWGVGHKFYGIVNISLDSSVYHFYAGGCGDVGSQLSELTLYSEKQ